MNILADWIPQLISSGSVIFAGWLVYQNGRLERAHSALLKIEIYHGDEIVRYRAMNLMLSNPSREPITASLLRLSDGRRKSRYLPLSHTGFTGSQLAQNALASSVVMTRQIDLAPGGANTMVLFPSAIALNVVLYRIPASDLKLELVTGHGVFVIPENDDFRAVMDGMVNALEYIETHVVELETLQMEQIMSILGYLQQCGFNELETFRQWVLQLLSQPTNAG
ncbi:hypothetical protein ACNAWD_29030 [Rhodococcus erythropolis]|uniref:hypothetical protein n=1 Tax=Rhodococcus TaxID=1827 RepID=UPI000B9CF31C|nr:hypothetical protein [Rhodococcus sp. 66b]OXM19511.1 hypothetical protein CBI33_21380 [Rhodococcus erythropolis]